MGFTETVLLGAIAGLTIFLGLPVGRIGHVSDRVRVALAMFSVGILAFIFMDVTKHAQEIVASTLDEYKAHTTGFGHVLGLFALLGLVVANIRRGVVGRRLIAVRSNERAAASVGVSVLGAKLYSFAVAAAIASVGGTILAFRSTSVTCIVQVLPTTVHTGVCAWRSAWILASPSGPPWTRQVEPNAAIAAVFH